MINIQNAIRVPYNQGANFMTIYFDFQNENIMYAVPVPRIASDNGIPAISVTRYITNDLNAFGYLNMDVEVEVPTEARIAAEEKFPGKNWGQFQWVATSCYLKFDLPSVPGGMIMQGQPSLYGSNRANFQFTIQSTEDLNAIVGAFRGQPQSSFQLEYDMSTLAMLQDVTAVVKFDASIAIEFETQWKEETDDWGNEQRVAAGIKKNLKISKAGDVEITWKIPNPSADMEARVNDWAWTTLEKAVANAVATAQAAATNSNPVNALDSFEQQYTENSVVEWNIISSVPLAGFSDEVWDSKIMHEVDNRLLAINFSLKGELVTTTGNAVCQDVEVTVKYPTKTTGNTFTLVPVADARSMLTYTAPGYINPATQKFDPQYEYRYKIRYTDTDTYDSGWQQSTQTEVSIIPNELGAKKVTFVASNIPFGSEPDQVKKVRIDFFFQRPAGQVNQTQIGELTANNDTGQVFESYFNVPLTNAYTYRFIYELNNGMVKVMNTISDFGNVNSNLYLIQSLIQEQEFTLRASRVKDGASVDFVYLDVNYKDPQNNDRLSHKFDWEIDWSGSTRSTRDEKWKYVAAANPTGAFYEMNGNYESSDDEIIEIKNVIQQSGKGTFLIQPGFSYFGIRIIPSNIDWNVVSAVTVLLSQRQGGTSLSENAASMMITNSQKNLRTLADGENFNIELATFIPPDVNLTNLDYYYVVKKPLNQPDIEFYYNATYIQKDGPSRDSGEIKVTNKSSVVLPANGIGSLEPALHKISIPSAEWARKEPSQVG